VTVTRVQRRFCLLGGGEPSIIGSAAAAHRSAFTGGGGAARRVGTNCALGQNTSNKIKKIVSVQLYSF